MVSKVKVDPWLIWTFEELSTLLSIDYQWSSNDSWQPFGITTYCTVEVYKKKISITRFWMTKNNYNAHLHPKTIYMCLCIRKQHAHSHSKTTYMCTRIWKLQVQVHLRKRCALASINYAHASKNYMHTCEHKITGTYVGYCTSMCTSIYVSYLT